MRKLANQIPFLWPIKRLINSRFSNSILKQFHDDIKDTDKRIILLYDCKTVPPTIGDFSYVIVLLRYLIHHKRKLTLIVVNSEFRDDWSNLSSYEIDNFLKELKNISSTLLDDNNFEFQICSWSNQLVNELQSKHVSVLFSRNVFSRSGFYSVLPNLLNDLLHQINSELLQKVLFSKLEFPTIKKPLPKKYVTLIVRFSSKWGGRRNTTLEDLLVSVQLINQRMPDFDVVIVSDELACNYFREETKNFHSFCSFSKDYSSSFLEDVSVILGGSYCFQFNAGGICVYPIFSDMPYLFVMDPGNYNPWKLTALTSFSNSDQQFFGTTRKAVFFDNIVRI